MIIMRVLTYIQDGRFCLGLVKGEGNTVVSFSKLGLEYASMEEFIEDYSEIMKEEIEKKLEGVTGIPYESLEKAGVIPHPKSDVICLGINYAEHAESLLDMQMSLVESVHIQFIFRREFVI